MVRILSVCLVVFSLTGATGSTFARVPQPLSTGVTCEEAFANAPTIKTGMTEEEVLSLLGTPAAVSNATWGYSFWACLPRPQVGRQMIIGISLTFKDKVVVKIDYATMCATGPAPR
jgi:outer membrane protein assembly factor BamE (lipoprotein component of BamABCDE complex)